MIRKFENTRQFIQPDDEKILKAFDGQQLAMFELQRMFPTLRPGRIKSALHKLGLHGLLIKTEKQVINPATSMPMFKYKKVE